MSMHHLLRSLVTSLSLLLHGCTSSALHAPCPLMPRPQTPRERPYIVEPVVIDGGSRQIRLAGELTRPYGSGPFPAVVLISGSEPTDRNSAILGHEPFLVLSDHLTRLGYAVLRYDVRGYGESTGDVYSATDADFSADAAAALEWLRSRELVNPSRAGLIGHSQGGFKAVRAAQIERPDFMIFLAGGVEPIGTLLLRQTLEASAAAGLSQSELATQERELRAIFDVLRSSATMDEARDRVESFALAEGARRSSARRLAATFATPWLWSEFRRTENVYGQVDTQIADMIRRFDGPILAIYGGKDQLVSAAINAPLTQPLLSHPASRVVTLPDLNHFLQPAIRGGIEEVCEIETTLDESALSVIAEWLAAEPVEQ